MVEIKLNPKIIYKINPNKSQLNLGLKINNFLYRNLFLMMPSKV